MTRPSLSFLLILMASLGITIGLVWYVGKEWYEDHEYYRDRENIPGRFPVAQFITGVCGTGRLSLNQDRLDAHLNTFDEDLALREGQKDLIGQLIVMRAQVSCDLRQGRMQIHELIETDPFDDPEITRLFIERVLAFRQALSEEALREAQIQKQLLDSFTQEQIAAVTLHNLPRLIPGLSLREFNYRPLRSRDRNH